MKNKEKYILIFLLLIILVSRLYHINVPPLEIEESWRQADTESMARNFVEYDFNPLRPNLNYDGPLPNIPALEIQVTTFVIAILYKFFGYHYFLARMVPIIFFLISCVYFYLLARKYLSIRGAMLSLFIYGFLPLNLYYSRAIMPEAGALMFWIGGIYYFELWAEAKHLAIKPAFKLAIKPAIKPLVLSMVLFSLALMTKPPVVFGAIFLLYICFRYFGRQWPARPEVWIYAAITLGLALAYYVYSASIAEYKFSLGITRDIILQKALTAFYTPESQMFFLKNGPRAWGIIGLLLTLAGVFTVRKNQIGLLIWLGAMLLELLLIVAPIRATYYLIFALVPCALLIGNFLDRLLALPGGKVVSLALAVLFMMESIAYVKPMYTINETMAVQKKLVEELTVPSDLLVVGSLDPCLLSLSGRRGWRYNLGMYSYLPQDPYQELGFYIEHGAKYFVPIQGKVYGDDNQELIRYIEQNYPKIESVQGYPIYVLQGIE
ncbi:MAG: dolichyl-phosphate-mannose--protein mannosyltransferase [Peptococcaceae bacterium]|jgi:4-amino-4-deoxy-L-arabinose transferase-like glycosyltransferase|nr:dolichyl-phosphate-mannose--protein mannosyltransferase [Peptococcaceae bacterium]